MKIIQCMAIMALVFCVIMPTSALTIEQKAKIKQEMTSILGSAPITEMDVDFGKDLITDVIEVKILPDVGVDLNRDQVANTFSKASAPVIQKYLEIVHEYNQDLELDITFWEPGLRAKIGDNETPANQEVIEDREPFTSDKAHELLQNVDLFEIDVIGNKVVVSDIKTNTYDAAAEVAQYVFEKLYQDPRVAYVIVLHPPTYLDQMGMVNVDVVPIFKIRDEVRDHPSEVPQFNSYSKEGVKWIFAMTMDEAKQVENWSSLNMSMFAKA